MFVGRDGCAVCRPLRIAVAHGLPVLREVAEDLIVSAIFFDDVDDVPNSIIAEACRSAGKDDLFLRGLHAIRGQHGRGPAGEAIGNLLFVECRK